MDESHRLIGIEEKLNEITTLIHEHFQSCLLSMNNIYLKSIAQLTEDNFQDFQQRRKVQDVVKNLESHINRISTGVKEDIKYYQFLREKNRNQENFINFIFYVDNVLPSLTLKLIGSYLGVS